MLTAVTWSREAHRLASSIYVDAKLATSLLSYHVVLYPQT